MVLNLSHGPALYGSQSSTNDIQHSFPDFGSGMKFHVWIEHES